MGFRKNREVVLPPDWVQGPVGEVVASVAPPPPEELSDSELPHQDEKELQNEESTPQADEEALDLTEQESAPEKEEISPEETATEKVVKNALLTDHQETILPSPPLVVEESKSSPQKKVEEKSPTPLTPSATPAKKKTTSSAKKKTSKTKKAS